MFGIKFIKVSGTQTILGIAEPEGGGCGMRKDEKNQIHDVRLDLSRRRPREAK
jgi:hypothetical protein